MEFPDKFVLTRPQNLFLAKKKWDENIFCGMKMEHRNITFPETQTILYGVNVPSVTINDIQAILNMRDAWRYVITVVDEPPTIALLCNVNAYVARNESIEWGELRKGRVGITGTEYVPPIPIREEIEREWDAIWSAEMTHTEKALIAFLWAARRHMFWDGNKRTALLLANHILVAHGHGMLTIRETHMPTFHQLLSAFYTTNDMHEIKAFLYDHAIDGITF